MITLQELCAYLDNLLQTASMTDYAVNGLQVEGRQEISRVATAVTASLATIQAAAESGAHALIVHHGLFWDRDSQVIRGVKKEKLELLLKKEISLLSYHLPLDLHREFGNNWKAACEMGWTDLQPFGVYHGVAIGVKGRVNLMTRDSFKEKLEEYYQHLASSALGGKELVRDVALISGGAHKSIEEASRLGLDCFVTGSFDEPTWHQAYEGKINFFALGHSATERIGPKALGAHLQEKFNVECPFIDITNPF